MPGSIYHTFIFFLLNTVTTVSAINPLALGAYVVNARPSNSATSNMWQGRCGWTLLPQNKNNYDALTDHMTTYSYQFATDFKAHEIFWCESGLCAWTDRDGVSASTLKAAAVNLQKSGCCGSCGNVALDGKDMSKGMLTYNYPSERHNKLSGPSETCNQFSIVDKTDG